MNRLRILLVALLAFSAGGCYATDILKVGKSAELSAGTYSFDASPIAFNGRSFGYASTNYPPNVFSDRYWVYLSCKLTPKNPDSDGECMQWRIFDSASRKSAKLNLPGFDSFWSVPGFSWPYIAYIDVGSESKSEQRQVFCVLYDFAQKRIVQRQRQWVSENTFATDFPHMFLPPEVLKTGKGIVFKFGFDDVGRHRTLCELSAP